MPDCEALKQAAERARQNWLTKHAGSCKNLPANTHSSDCNAANQFYQTQVAAWASQCGQAAE